MKHYFKSYTLALFSIIFLMFFTSCEEENFISEQAAETETEEATVHQENPLLVREVSQADIPNVLSKIKGKMSSAAKFYGNKMVQDDIEIYLDQVKEAVKKGEHSNYTFPIHVEGAPLTELYVLGIDKYTDGTIGEPIVTKYKLSQESYDYFMNENNGIIDFRYFKADYSYYTFDEFFSKKANKSANCQGTMGAGPGFYPTTEPGGSITNGTTVTGITVGFSNTVIHTTTYVYTSNVPSTNGQTSSVSTLASSSVITTTTEPTGDTSGTVPGPTVINVPNNAASVTQETQPVSSGGAACVNPTHVINGAGGSQHYCPAVSGNGNNTHNYQDNKSATPCTPFNYSAVNTLDLWSARMAHEFSVPGGFMQQNREFTQPLKDLYNQNTNSFTNRNFGHKLMMGVVDTKITEVEGMQILFSINFNNASERSIAFGNDAVSILTNQYPTTNIPYLATRVDYERELRRIANHFKYFGDPEEEIFAAYIESLLPDLYSMTSGEVHDIYELAKQQTIYLTYKYFRALVYPTVNAAIPFVVYALTEATLGAALPLLSRIPLKLVTRGTKLESLVKQIGVLGVKGSGNNIRIVTTNSPITKSKELFNSLTRNAISKVTESNGAIKANMGNGNFITYRPVSASSSNFPATISLDFRAAGIWTKIRNIKFVSP